MTAAARPADPKVDLQLLRRHEPIVRYTLGEAFFPMEVTTYLAHATLWEREPSWRREGAGAAG